MKPILFLAIAAGLATAEVKLPEMAVFQFVDVIPSMTAEFEASQAVLRDSYKKGGVPFRMAYTRLFGGPQTLAIVPLSDISSWDNGPISRKLMGEQNYEKWLTSFRRTNSGTTMVLARPIPNLTILDAPRGTLPVMVMQRTRVAVDRRAEFEARVRDVVIPALKKAGVKRYILSRVVFGGGSNEYITTRSHNSLAEAEKANQVIANLPMPAGMFLSSERLVFRFNPKLSYVEGMDLR